MNIRMTGRHCEYTPGLQSFTEERLNRLEKFAADIVEAHVVLTQEKFRHHAEITVKVGQQDLMATVTSNEPGDAILMAADRMEEQVRRLHDRRTRDRRHGEPVRDVTATPSDPSHEEA